MQLVPTPMTCSHTVFNISPCSLINGCFTLFTTCNSISLSYITHRKRSLDISLPAVDEIEVSGEDRWLESGWANDEVQLVVSEPTDKTLASREALWPPKEGNQESEDKTWLLGRNPVPYSNWLIKMLKKCSSRKKCGYQGNNSSHWKIENQVGDRRQWESVKEGESATGKWKENCHRGRDWEDYKELKAKDSERKLNIPLSWMLFSDQQEGRLEKGGKGGLQLETVVGEGGERGGHFIPPYLWSQWGKRVVEKKE